MSHLRDVVHPRRKDTVAILVADREPCIALAQDEELKQSGRAFLRTTAQGLAALRLPASWCMAVVLCDGDDAQDLAAWAAGGADLDRVHFYVHAKADLAQVFKAWSAARLPIHSVREGTTSWRDLSRHFGERLNQQCHDDYCKEPQCPLR